MLHGLWTCVQILAVRVPNVLATCWAAGRGPCRRGRTNPRRRRRGHHPGRPLGASSGRGGAHVVRARAGSAAAGEEGAVVV